MIEADNVTLDLNGFAITGAGGGGIGITESAESGGRAGIVILNGTIAKVGAAVFMPRSTRVHIEQIHVSATTVGIALGTDAAVTSADSIVARNIVSVATGSGIFIGRNSIATGNVVSGGGLRASQRSLITGNTVSKSVDGITVECPSNVVENTAQGNANFDAVFVGSDCSKANNSFGTVSP